jgi:hypothetical protein
MAVQSQGQVGPQTLSDGAFALLRMGRSGELILQELHGQFYETTKRGNVFRAVTAIAGVAPGTALGATAAFALFNPPNSGKDLVVIRAFCGKLSGTLGDGTIFACQNILPGQAAPTGTVITPLAANLSNAKSVATALTTATLPATPTAIDGLFTIEGGVIQNPEVDVKGGLIVTPGGILSLEGIAAAGAAPLVFFGMAWEEVPV